MMRCLLLIIYCLCVWLPLYPQTQNWVQTWMEMPEDTHKVRFLHQQLRGATRMGSDSLLMLATQGQALAKALDDPRGMAAMSLYQGFAHADNGHIQEAARLMEQSVRLYQSLGDQKQTAGSLVNLGICYFDLGQQEQALQTYLEAAKAYQAVNLPNSRLYNNIAIIYRQQKKYARAVEYYEKSLDLKRAEKDSLGMANVWFNLVNLDLYRKDTLQAITHAQQALFAYQTAGEEGHIASTHVLLAILYRRSNQEHLVPAALEAAWRYYADNPSGKYYMLCLSEFAAMYAQEKNWTKANAFYQQAIQLAYEWELESDQQILLEHHSTVLKEMGQSSAAFDSLSKSHELMRNLTEEKRLALSEEMQARFEVQQAEQREEIQAEGFSKEQAQSRIIMALIGLLLLGAVIFLFVNVRKNSRLRLKQQQIEQALEEKEAIMREMHHRIKNNLQFLSSLLRLQARDLDDVQARDALLHSRSRVLSMALIHKHLYEDKGRTAIHMDAYLEKLTQDVMGSLTQPDRQIDFHLEAAPLILDVDRAIPVALITHEAIVNAMKYAFEGRETGNLSVSLTASTQSVQLQIQDDGIGTQTAQQGFGQRLIHLLAERLSGQLEFVSDVGFQLSLDFPLTET